MTLSPKNTILPTPSCDWDQYNDLLVDRGDLSQFFPALHEGFRQLPEENAVDPQHPKIYPEVLFQILLYDREYNSTKWRQLEGVTRTLCEPFGYPVPDYTTIYNRSKGLTLRSLLGAGTGGYDGPNPPIEEDAVDSTGLKLSDAGEYLHDKYKPSERKIWLKFHIICNTHNHKIRAYRLTSSKVPNGEACNPMVNEAHKKKKINKLFGDTGYDWFSIFDHCDEKGIIAVIKPRKNARSRSRGHGPTRGRTVWEIHKIGLKKWKE